MKLSGCFSELFDPTSSASSPHATPSSAPDCAKLILPWLRVIFQEFGAERILFGSDWPVCNMSFPGAAKGNHAWFAWKRTVEEVLGEVGCSERERERVWWVTAEEVYGL